MLGLLGAMAAVLVVGVVPGALLLAAAHPGITGDPARWFAAAPAITIGIVFVLSSAASAIGVDIVPWVPGAVAVLSIAGIAWRRPSMRSRGSVSRHERIALVLLIAAMIAGAAVWITALNGEPLEPPSRDGEYHGFFAKRIVDESTVAIADVVVTDPITQDAAASYYPLALHAIVAVQHQVLGAAIGPLLTAWAAMSAFAFLPAAMHVVVRHLVPREPLVAGFTALAVPMFLIFPYRPIDWGAVPLIVGQSLVPVVVALIATAGDSAQPRHAAIAGVAAFGVASVHTSQLGLVVGIATIVEVAALSTAPTNGARVRRLAGLAGAGAVFAVLFAPTLLALGSAAGERTDFIETPWQTTADALGSILTLSFMMEHTQEELVIVAAAGMLIAARHRLLTAWMVVCAALIVVFLAASTINGPWHWLRPATLPWYSSSWRTSYHVPIGFAVFVGVALWGASRSAASWAQRWRPIDVSRTALAMGGAFLVVGALHWLPRAATIIEVGHRTDSLVDADLAAAFEFIEARTDRSDVLLNEERDGSAWIYARHDRRPLLAVYSYERTASTVDRIYLLEHIAEIGDDQRVERLVQRWDIEWVLANDRGFTDEPPRLDREALRANQRLVEEFSSGGSSVFRVLPTPDANR